jgi:hypothetical protein
MIRLLPRRAGLVWIASAFLLANFLLVRNGGAQEKGQAAQGNLRYDASREVSVRGTVINYAENSTAAPFGPHVMMQTSSGVLDVHLGNAQLLESNHFALAAGDEIRVIGENVTLRTGTQFLARLVQKGNQALTLRGASGFPLRPKSGSNAPAGAQ